MGRTSSWIDVRIVRRVLGIALLGVMLPLTLGLRARAAGTDPTLVLAEGDAYASATGVVGVTVSGAFSFDDVVQFPMTGGLIVSQGSLWVRYDFSGVVRSGTASFVANGITADEIPALLAAGGVAAAPAALVQVQSNRMTAALPPSFGSGPSLAVVYAVLAPDSFVSNTITVTLP